MLFCYTKEREEEDENVHVYKEEYMSIYKSTVILSSASRSSRSFAKRSTHMDTTGSCEA